MHVIPATIAYQAYGRDSIIERFQCNYGLNEKYRNDLNDGKFKITGFDEDKPGTADYETLSEFMEQLEY